MSTTNQKLHRAKADAFDEFYTQIEDIENEMCHYDLRGMSVYSPCDDYRWSNFARYFKDHFKNLGLKKYCCTNYDIGEGAWRYEYDGITETVVRLDGDGDFRSPECMSLADAADVVISNPPFSLFREYVGVLMDRGTKFILIGNQNAVTYKEIFPYFKENMMWWGVNCVRWFVVPDGCGKATRTNASGCPIAEGARSRWFTNVEHAGRHDPMKLTESYDPARYRRYDNCDAIDVPKTALIPKDYDGSIGVPITFLDRYCPDQFELLRFRKGDDGDDLKIGGKETFFRILVKRL